MHAYFGDLIQADDTYVGKRQLPTIWLNFVKATL